MPSTQTDLIDGVSTSTALKSPCRVFAASPITLSGLQTVDGVALAEGDRVVVDGQADQTQNGIYDATGLAWTRSPDFDGARDAVKGTRVTIIEGTTYAGRIYELTTANPVLFGSSSITWQDVTTIYLTGTIASPTLQSKNIPADGPPFHLNANTAAIVEAKIDGRFVRPSNYSFDPATKIVTWTGSSIAHNTFADFSTIP